MEFYALADEKVQRSIALLPWRHNILIISKAKSLAEAKYQIRVIRMQKNSLCHKIFSSFNCLHK
jgi:hypothetical protein